LGWRVFTIKATQREQIVPGAVRADFTGKGARESELLQLSDDAAVKRVAFAVGIAEGPKILRQQIVR
jgi:hypothetical protein